METVGLDFARLFGGAFYGKKVLVTGHTGFKGSWLSLWLYLMGARVYGYALAPVCAADNFTLENNRYTRRYQGPGTSESGL